MDKADTNRTNDAYLEVVGDVLLRAFILGFGLLILSSFAYILIGNEIASEVGEGILGISAENFTNMNFFGMMMFKMVLFGFFLLPYIAIQWTLARRKVALHEGLGGRPTESVPPAKG